MDKNIFKIFSSKILLFWPRVCTNSKTCRKQLPQMNAKNFLFDLIIYVPPTIFQLNRDGSSWVEPVLS